MRIFLGFLATGFALAAAVYLNQYKLHRFHGFPGPDGYVIERYRLA